MIGSVFVVRMTWLHKLVWHTNDRRRVTRLPTHLFDSGSHGSVCDVPEVPGYHRMVAFAMCRKFQVTR